MYQSSITCMDIDVSSDPVSNKSLELPGYIHFSKCVVTVTNLLRKIGEYYIIPLLWLECPSSWSLVSSVFVYQDQKFDSSLEPETVL